MNKENSFLDKLISGVKERRLPWRVKHKLDSMKIAVIRSVTRRQFLRILETPPIISDNECDVEVHTLIDHNFLIYYLVAIKSFYFFAKRKFSIYCHCCTNNMTSKDVEILKKHIVGVNFVDRETSDKIMKERLSGYRLCLKYRDEIDADNSSPPKLFDQILISKTKKLILLDADTLFFNYPSEIIEWADSDASTSLYLKDIMTVYMIEYPAINEIKGLPRVPPHFNAGLLCFDKRVLTDNLDRIEELCRMLLAHGGDFCGLDQTIFAMLLPNKRILPHTYTCKISEELKNNKDLIFKHYVGRDVRFGSFIYRDEGMRVIDRLMAQ